MLNPFPELLDFALFAPLMLRIVLGLVFIQLGSLKYGAERNRWLVSVETLSLRPPTFWVSVLGVLECVGGIMLFVGFYTQIAALVLATLALIELYIEHKGPSILTRSNTFYLLLFTISLSLLFSGAGFFAIDLPL